MRSILANLIDDQYIYVYPTYIYKKKKILKIYLFFVRNIKRLLCIIINEWGLTKKETLQEIKERKPEIQLCQGAKGWLIKYL